jgi:uncharacterized protein YdeI (YjbR/CyaY-like superfamily)
LKTTPLRNPGDLESRHFKTKAEWTKWLAKNHLDSRGLWLEFAKADSAQKSIKHADALEVALCHGWIDGLAQRIDEDFWRLRFGPRKKQSIWSKINRDRALALIEQGKMQPAGFAAIEQAKANGRWDAAYEGSKKSVVPADLQAELDQRPRAAEFFASLDAQNRYAILFRLQTANNPKTRAARLAKFVEMLERGERLHPKAK